MKHFKHLLFAIPIVAFLIMGCNATKSQKGAVIGGTAGAIIGRDMDKQAEEIKNDIPGAKVERVAEGIKVEFNEKILFAFSKSDIGDSARINLNKLVTVLNKYPNTNIEIQGHTDSRGTDEY